MEELHFLTPQWFAHIIASTDSKFYLCHIALGSIEVCTCRVGVIKCPFVYFHIFCTTCFINIGQHFNLHIFKTISRIGTMINDVVQIYRFIKSIFNILRIYQSYWSFPIRLPFGSQIIIESCIIISTRHTTITFRTVGKQLNIVALFRCNRFVNIQSFLHHINNGWLQVGHFITIGKHNFTHTFCSLVTLYFKEVLFGNSFLRSTGIRLSLFYYPIGEGNNIVYIRSYFHQYFISGSIDIHVLRRYQNSLLVT